MKVIFSVFAILLFSVLGCGTSQVGHQYEYQEPNVKVNPNIGYLKIHTVDYEEGGKYSDDPIYKYHKGYTIYPRDSENIIDVNKSLQEPRLVKLKEGDYIVLAELYNNIIYSINVKIETGKILEIDKSMIEHPFKDLK